MDYTYFSRNIYENPDVPINKFLINLQREDDCGYFCKECFDLDSNNSYKELSTGFFRNWDKHSIEFLILIKEYFKHIIEKFNNNDSNIEFSKSNTGLIIILKNCVIRIIKYKRYNKLKKLYDALSQERTGENIKYDNFERIYKIYNLDIFDIVIIVSEKVISIKSYDGEIIKSEFKPNIRNIIESIKISRQYIHELGYLHNDLSLDNTGYRLSDNKFIVFDFDMVSYDPSRALPKYDVIRGYE
jgi:tRNA A-37 threonylcarbamoyl transferase component Bud32